MEIGLIKLDLMYVICSCILFVVILFARENRDSAKAIVLGVIIGNILNYKYVINSFSTHFIEIFFLNLVLIIISIVVIKLLDLITNRFTNMINTILIILSSFGLCYVYLMAQQIVIYILTVFHELIG